MRQNAGAPKAPTATNEDSGASGRFSGRNPVLVGAAEACTTARGGYGSRVDAGLLPGEELVEQGLRDLAVGTESPEALLVSIGAPRLAALGIEVCFCVDAQAQVDCRRVRPEKENSILDGYTALVR